MVAGNPLHSHWSPNEPVPLPEYPRPQMTRPGWINLNGWWQYAIQGLNEPVPQEWQGSILVPYPLESQLSGVQKPLLPDQKLWYFRSFADPRKFLFNKNTNVENQRVLLHFGAVDHESEIWVNGNHIGGHIGGYLPFSLDITNALISGQNEILVSVLDPGEKGLQQRGKQVLDPKEIWYTSVSGIWQTVWLEGVTTCHISRLKLTPDLDKSVLVVEAEIAGVTGDEKIYLEAEASFDGVPVATSSGLAGSPLNLSIPKPVLWSPAQPALYDLQIHLIRDGNTIDNVGSYFAMRKFGLQKDATGHLRFALNGEPLFLYGPLDQGYHCDGLYTPASDEALLFDIDYARRIGCNLIRKHVKVEPLRWYYHCDRLGMIVWQDMPNGGKIDGLAVALATQVFGFHRKDTHRLGRFGRSDETNRKQFMAELKGLIDLLYNSACVVTWVPFNESWGQFQANQVAEWVKAYDPTRLVEHASGWFDQGGGDIQSRHIYFKKLRKPKADGRVFLLSEIGGYSLKISGHVWNEAMKFGYRFYDNPEELTDAYRSLLEKELKPLISQGLAGAIYTQTADVEIEINGFLTYDRQVEKMDAGILQGLHQSLMENNF